jgi:hypothetical protein
MFGKVLEVVSDMPFGTYFIAGLLIPLPELRIGHICICHPYKKYCIPPPDCSGNY